MKIFKFISMFLLSTIYLIIGICLIHAIMLHDWEAVTIVATSMILIGTSNLDY